MTADAQLLASYVRDRSQEAFGELVARHLNLVYGAARRQLGNEALAQDVTQAVFIMLATKAESLRTNVIVPAWLLTATWYACKNATRREHRRRIHERGASLMRRETGEEAASSDPQLNRVLDEALISLRESDRAAVVMHYLQGQTFNDVAAALHTTPEAARKRAVRALDKLRDFFRRAGVTMDSSALADGLSRQAAHIAPAVLPGAVLAVLASGESSGEAYTIAHAAVRAMHAAKVKLVAGLCAATAAILVVIAGVVVTAAPHSPRPAAARTAQANANLAPSPLVQFASPMPATMPIGTSVTFPNAIIAPIAATNMTQYTFGDDAQAKRLPDGFPPVFIASRPEVPAPGPVPAMRGWYATALPWRGKRVELSVYLRTQDVRKVAGVNVLVWGAENRSLGGNMDGGLLRITGTHNWTRISNVFDVPRDAVRIEFGAGLWGPGQVWIHSFTMAPVSPTTPLTSDATWHLAAESPALYRLVNDDSQPRNGRATARLESTTGPIANGESAKLVRVERSLDAFRGKRVRVRAVIRSADVAVAAGLFARAGSFDASRRFSQAATEPQLPVHGTMGWLAYAATLDVPMSTDMLWYGVQLDGSGTVWIDDLTLEALPSVTNKSGR